ALAERGVAITPRRQRLLEVLLASDRHPSVSEIHEGVKRYYPGTSLATIYNTIELLKETDQVLEIEFSGASNRYDGRIPKSHPHLVCEVCEKVEDLDIGELKDPFEDISSSTGYRILRRRVDYYGVCPDCQGNPLDSDSQENGGKPGK
ncbi:MAG: transcriptional repressor, partial [Chloroflexi bacterium]|nr:transcriptional repressor [Chloroflexota bacterium]